MITQKYVSSQKKNLKHEDPLGDSNSQQLPDSILIQDNLSNDILDVDATQSKYQKLSGPETEKEL
jgi:hypothetical protein